MMAAVAHSATCTWGAGRVPTASKDANNAKRQQQQKTRSSSSSSSSSSASADLPLRAHRAGELTSGSGAGAGLVRRHLFVTARAAAPDDEGYGDATASSGDESFGGLAPSRGAGGNWGEGGNGGRFRSKTGGVGDVLESGGSADDGTDYSAAVETPNSNNAPIEGRVVKSRAASEAAGLADIGEGELYDGGDAMDILFNEIASKTSIDDDDMSMSMLGRQFGDAPAPPAVGSRFVDAPTAPVVNGKVIPGAPPTSAANTAGSASDPQVMPASPGSARPSMPPPGFPPPSAVVTRLVNPMDQLYDDLMLESALLDEGDLVETVQIIGVRFKVKKQVNFGEVLRMVGGHESMGSWSLRKSPALNWSEGDNWVSEDIELPVDGVYVYKYVVTDAADASKPVSWQKGNNQVLTLRAEDAPLVVVQDSWSGDPSKAYTSRADGSDKMQAEVRLVQRIGDADAALHESRMEVMDLRVDVKSAQLQSAALREEARLSSNVRLKLKQQLQAEKKRSEVLEEQVTEWKNRFKQLGAGKVPPKKLED